MQFTNCLSVLVLLASSSSVLATTKYQSYTGEDCKLNKLVVPDLSGCYTLNPQAKSFEYSTGTAAKQVELFPEANCPAGKGKVVTVKNSEKCHNIKVGGIKSFKIVS